MPGKGYLDWKMSGFDPKKTPSGATKPQTRRTCGRDHCKKQFMATGAAKYCPDHRGNIVVAGPCPLCKVKTHGVVCKKCRPKLKVRNIHSTQGRGLVRLIARVRDKFTCQDCGFMRTQRQVDNYNAKHGKGKMKSLDIHHLDGECGEKTKKYEAVTSLPKLVTLCHQCHFNRHDFSLKGKASMRQPRRTKISK